MGSKYICDRNGHNVTDNNWNERYSPTPLSYIEKSIRHDGGNESRPMIKLTPGYSKQGVFLCSNTAAVSRKEMHCYLLLLYSM